MGIPPVSVLLPACPTIDEDCRVKEEWVEVITVDENGEILYDPLAQALAIMGGGIAQEAGFYFKKGLDLPPEVKVRLHEAISTLTGGREIPYGLQEILSKLEHFV